MAAVENASGLSPSQVLILKVLVNSSVGMSGAEISHAAGGVPVSSSTIGPVFEDSLHNYPDSLRGRGFVRPEQYEGDDVRWSITEEGRKFWRERGGLKAKKIGPQKRIPNEVLDPVAAAMKRTRTYPFEEYSREDMIEMRGKLPAQYHDVDLDDIRKQAQARRKQGAFTDPNEKYRKVVLKLYREFGPTGTVNPGFLTEDQLQWVYDQVGSDVTEGS